MLKSEEMKALVSERAQEIANRCGEGYEVNAINAGTRYIASVATTDAESMKDNLENNTLLKALR